jgi:hypothetical protein
MSGVADAEPEGSVEVQALPSSDEDELDSHLAAAVQAVGEYSAALGLAWFMLAWLVRSLLAL